MAFSHLYVDTKTGAVGWQGDLLYTVITLDGEGTWHDPTTGTTGATTDLRYWLSGKRETEHVTTMRPEAVLEWIASTGRTFSSTPTRSHT